MARSSQEIESSIDTQAANHQELDALQSNSSMVSFWLFTKKMMVFVSLTLEVLFDKLKSDIQAINDSEELGGMDWYLGLCYEYQHGDSLIIENNRPVYSQVDESKQIIKRASISEFEDGSGNIALLIKAVKESGGDLVKLSSVELASFTTYLNRRKIVGTKLVVESKDGDILYFNANVMLDPLLFDGNGKLLSDPTAEPVKTGIEAFLKVFDRDEFGGWLYLSKLTQSVLEIDGVIDFYIVDSELNTQSFTQKIESDAGHFILDNTTQLNYVLS